MKRSLFFLALCMLQAAMLSATTYYVSPTGNDGNSGLTMSLAWKTIGKVNSSMSSFAGGDSILFQRNGSFSGSLVIGASGSSGHPIVFSAYGSGSNPIIRSDTALTGWTSDGAGSDRWKCAYNVRPLALYIGNVPQAIARYPNRTGTADEGYLTYNSYSGDTEIVSSTSLSNIWAGGEVVIRIDKYILLASTVTFQNGTGNKQIHFTPSSQPLSHTGYGYFFQNDTNALDQQGEWCYQNGDLYLYSTTNPSSLTISVSKYNYAINCKSHNYITFQDLVLEDADSADVLVSASNTVTIDSCTLTQPGLDGVDVVNGSTYFTCENSNLTHLPNDGVSVTGGNADAVIQYDTITNASTVAGMGANALDACCNAVFFDGNGHNFLCQYNYCDSIGRHGISLMQDSSTMTIQDNFIDHIGMVYEDLGGIHVLGKSGAIVNSNNEIAGNIIVNGVGTPFGTDDTTDNGFTHGIYLDQYSKRYVVTGNTVANMPGNGFELHNTESDTLRGNTLYGNGEYEENVLPGAQIFMDNEGAYPHDTALLFAQNILVSLDTDQKIMNLYESSSSGNACSTYGTYDTNYYCHPFYDTSDIIYVNDQSTGSTSYYGLAGWKTYASDPHSKPAPVYYSTFSSTDSVLLFYNNTQSVVSDPLPSGNGYMDVNHNTYSTSVSLNPYTSIVLFYKGSTSPVTSVASTVNEGDVLAYPDPNNGHFTVVAQGASANGYLEIYNLTGQKVYSVQLPGAGIGFAVDLSDQTGGIYFLRFENDKGAVVKKMIIEK